MRAMLAMVLAGGGARGAYEAGVLRYLYTDLARRLGVPPRPDIVSGTSVGAINGAWIASAGPEGAHRLWEWWQTVTIEQVYRFGVTDFLKAPSTWLHRPTEYGEAFCLFDPAPLHALAREQIDWPALHGRIDAGELTAFMVACTDVASGRTRIFVDGDVKMRRTATASAVRVRAAPEHCLASAAIPFVFPPVQIAGRYFVDGALRQNTPLSPAIEAGCDRVLVVGVKRLRGEEHHANVPPTPAFLAGKALNALLLDPIEENLRRIDHMNRFLRWGESRYPGFVTAVQADYKPYQLVEHCYVRPTEDLGAMAATILRASASKLPWATAKLLEGLSGGEDSKEADLVSYLFFDRHFTAEVEALGYRDAKADEERLAALIAPGAVAA
jgi:NTE family protein